VLIILLITLINAATKGDKADPVSQEQWGIVAFWGALFNGLWLWLLFVFDPDTWGRGDGWGGIGFVVRYIFPNAALVIFLLFRGWARRAVAITVICLLMGGAYWILS
jgi:hypothetical protein